MKGVSRREPLTSDEYLESVRDKREIWIYGERVRDVTVHPAFRNTVRMLSRLYKALHDGNRSVLCIETDTGNSGYTHKFFRPSRNADELVAARDAIAEWARLTYGWMGRSPDYMAAFFASMKANAEFFGPFQANAKHWYDKVQEEVTFVGHAFANPPVDRNRKLSDVRDVYMHVEKETDGGLIISGAKVVATAATLTHYNLVANDRNPVAAENKDFAFVCIVPTEAPGVKMFCRPSYEMTAAGTGSPFDYPLSSRFDENDSILIFENVFVPWENVFAYGDIEKVNKFFLGSGFVPRYMLHGCTRLAVKLDFIAGLLLKGVEATGTADFRGVQAQVGEVLGWRNLFWALTDAMARTTEPWTPGFVLPSLSYGLAYQVAASHIYPHLKDIIENVLASSLIYVPSHVVDFKTPEIRPYLDQFLRGTKQYSSVDRVKVMKLMRDALSSEFASRHALYERNYFGSHEGIRVQLFTLAELLGKSNEYKGFADQCMSEYDLDGWTVPDLVNPDDINLMIKTI